MPRAGARKGRQVTAQRGGCHPVEISLEIKTGPLTNTRSLAALSLAGEEKQAGEIHSEQNLLRLHKLEGFESQLPRLLCDLG